MTREEARDYIHTHASEHFKPDKSGKGFICPVCGSGGGVHGTGITENPKSRGHFTCWRGCFENADIFEIVGMEFRLRDYNEQFEKCCDIFGLSVGRDSLSTPSVRPCPSPASPSPTELVNDYTEFCRMAAQQITQTDYHRSISLETLKRFGVGYAPEWRHPKSPNSPLSPRLIIPNGNGGYLARDTRKDLTDEQQKYAKQRAGKVGLFNAEALKQASQPVWIVEGELDALSIIDVGGQAVALCSTANVKKLLEAVQEYKPKAELIILLDNDKAGREASEKLTEGLEQCTFSFYRHSKIPAPYKDANDYLMASRENFADWVKATARELFTAEHEAFEREAAAYTLNDFIAKVAANRERSAIPTGFSNLDKLLDGGLWPGLYFIGAVSSLGKTTLMLQTADNVAKNGYGVLIISLEMARSELIAKSLSRLTFVKSFERYETTYYAKTTRGILRGSYTAKEQELIRDAISEYGDFGRKIHIVEGVADLGTDVIRAKVEEYIKYQGKPPVIVVDYAQILAAPNVRRSLTDKQVVDINVTELKRISRDYDTPVISISSFNRDSYNAPVGMASFKESGAIEYSSDVLIGLQYYGWDYQDGEKAERDGARANRLRVLKERNEAAGRALGSQDIQLKVLKNRNGSKGSCRLEFFPAFNYWRESPSDSQ